MSVPTVGELFAGIGGFGLGFRRAGFDHAFLVEWDGKCQEVLVRELKDERGDLKPEQVEWLEALAVGGLDVGVWRPSDWPEIEGLLTGELRYRTRLELAEGILAEAVPVAAHALDANAKTRAWLHLWRQRVREPFAYTRLTRRARAAARPAKSSEGE